MRLNLDAKPRIEKISETENLLIIDEFYIDPYHVRERALAMRFLGQSPDDQAAPGGAYPGLLAPVQNQDPEVAAALDHFRALIGDVFAIDVEPSGAFTDFGLITTRPDKLSYAQRHPHVDGNPILGLVYLNPYMKAGTAFYRHRETRMCTVASRAQEQSIIQFVSDPRNALDLQGYIAASNRYWERIHSVEGVFNRFVAYSGQVFHSGDVFLPDADRLGEHRLTQRFLAVTARRRERAIQAPADGSP